MASSMSFTAFLLILACFAPAQGLNAELMGSNPIRRVTKMLQKMSAKIEEEGEQQEKLYEKFMCHCKNELKDFKIGKAAFEEAVPKLQAKIKQTKATIEQIQTEIDAKRGDESVAKDSMNAADTEREKEHDVYVKEDKELDESIETIDSTIPLLDKAMSGLGFLQTKAKVLAKLSKTQIQRMRNVVMNSKHASEHDRQLVNAFLAVGSKTPKGESTGDIKVILQDTLTEEKEEETANDEEEEKEKNIFLTLMEAKTEELDEIEETVAQKIDRQGEARVSLVELKGQLSDATKALNKDFDALAKLAETCKEKTADWEERKKMRADEVQAIAETIKILTSDDALEIFKKTLPSAEKESFLQLERGHDVVRTKALNLVQSLVKGKKAAAGEKARFDIVMLALSHRGVDFSKVQKMIDDMVALLKTEQKDDNDKKKYCAAQFFEVDKKVKVLDRKIKNQEELIEEKKMVVAELEPEIAEIQKGIEKLDQAVAESTEQRKEENQEFNELSASNGQAKDLLALAKNRMNKFYHPHLVPTTTPAAEEEAESFVQVEVRVHKQAPETYGEHKTQEGAGNTIVTMLEGLMNELDAEVAEAAHADKASQKLYEDLLEDSKAKRAADEQSIATKMKVKAEADTAVIKHNSTVKAEAAELKDVKAYEAELHEECDWLNKNYEVRKKARADERETLIESKAVLAGAR
eukprot:TRINITY_DN413_c0_g3_i1.p1 TRINITY_DN413_c0_g3~~TRINITY_DN413_c0_g3_i1.p1  ORF type:complete len:694 (-),score=261.98 TRINITY_DN413_c0_g3_i1:86-2167(-)